MLTQEKTWEGERSLCNGLFVPLVKSIQKKSYEMQYKFYCKYEDGLIS